MLAFLTSFISYTTPKIQSHHRSAHLFFSILLIFCTLPLSAKAQTSGSAQHGRDYVYKDEMEVEPDVRMTRCQRLERQLANIYIRGNNHSSAAQLADLNKQISAQRRTHKNLQRKADRKHCYEDTFFFGKELRRTRYCIKLDRQIRKAKNKLLRLDDQRVNLRRPQNLDNKREVLLEELAHNRCGKRYQQSRRRQGFGDSIFGGIFGGGSSDYEDRRQDEAVAPDQIKPYATYRTMCVRLCDGFYFPVSFSALPSKFDVDSTACQDRCAAPTQLFVYRNPGAEIEQMIAPDGGMPYSQLPNAYKFKKKFVKGCSCKTSEYIPEGTAEAASESKTAAQNVDANTTDSGGFETTVTSEDLKDLKTAEKSKTTNKKKAE